MIPHFGEKVKVLRLKVGEIEEENKMGEKLYTAIWFRYPHGVEGERMASLSRDFDNREKAINYLKGRCKRISSLNWAGGHVEDKNGAWLYIISDNGDEEKYI